MTQKNRKVRINWIGITWILLVIIAIVFFLILINFILFPQKYVLPLGLALGLIVAILGIFSLKKYKVDKRIVKKRIVTTINCILCVLLAAGSIYIPILEKQMKGIFVEPTKETMEVKINAYVMTSDYKAAHPDVFTDATTSTELDDYKDKKFLTQTKVDQDNQTFAVEDLQNQMGIDQLNTVSEPEILSSVDALYNGEGDVMILNPSYASSITEVSGYENFAKDTQVLYTVVRTVEVEQKEKINNVYTNSSFTIFIAGSDSRDSGLEYNTRTDTNVLVTVDPVNKQVLVVTIPRDWYVRNPALDNGFDKLTHLGNNGLQNTMDGLNNEFGFDYIKDYFEVNFDTFYNIIEAIGGVDIYNPYTFTLENGGTWGVLPHGEENGYTFEEGNLHLNGDQALSYVRERYSLPNGDFGRNEHQSIVLQAIINKLCSKEIITSYNTLLNNLQGNFLTSVSSDSIYSIAQMQLNDGGDWDFITYHLTGPSGLDVTASMGSQQLYVTYPLKNQVEFAKQQITAVMKGQTIIQATLPEDDGVKYLPD